MATPWKHPQTGIFYLRKSIPKDLRQVFSGRTVFKKSLGTKDQKKAKLLFLPELQKVEELLSMARQEGNIPFSPKQSLGIAGMWLKEALQEDDHLRDTQGPPQGEAESEDPYALELEHIADAETIKAKELWVLDDVRETLEGFGLRLPNKPSEGYKNLLEAFRIAKYEYFKVLSGRAQGKWVQVDIESKYPEFTLPKGKTPEKPKKAIANKGTSLETLLQKYHKEGRITSKTQTEFISSVQRFEKLVGKIPVGAKSNRDDN